MKLKELIAGLLLGFVSWIFLIIFLAIAIGVNK